MPAVPASSAPDKVFYTSDSLLYYFNKAANAVYQWTDITKPLDTTTPIFDGTGTLGGLTIYSVSADPVWPGLFWAVGKKHE